MLRLHHLIENDVKKKLGRFLGLMKMIRAI